MIVERLRFDGRTAMVSGAGGGGIGTATSLALAEAGANVVAVDIDAERAKETRDQVVNAGGKAVAVVADLRRKADAQRAVAEAVREFGGVHHVANVAGGMTPDQWDGMLTYGEEQFDAVIHMNLRYVYLINQAVANQIVKQGGGGSMASVASVSGLNGAPQHGAYGAAKAGLMSLTRTMAVERGQYGIRVNALAPGSVKTPRATQGGTIDADARAKDSIPIQRACEPYEIASGLLFLLSDLASAVSGHTLVVDGGAMAQFPIRSGAGPTGAGRFENR